jgi:hypothetical protein
METGLIILKEQILLSKVKELNLLLDKVNDKITPVQVAELVAHIVSLCVLINSIVEDISDFIVAYYSYSNYHTGVYTIDDRYYWQYKNIPNSKNFTQKQLN